MKGQIWYLDYLIGTTLFLVLTLLVFSFYKGSIYTDNGLYIESSKVAETLMTTGIPEEWNESNVVIIGLSDGSNVFSLEKISSFLNISRDYEASKFRLGITKDYIIYFENKSNSIINLTNQSYIGKYAVTDLDTENVKDIISFVRYGVLRVNNTAEIIAMKIVVFEEKE